MNRVDTHFRDMTYQHRLNLGRWRRAIDVEILKEAGNYDMERQQTIVLVEGDHQLNGKKLSKTVMRDVEKVTC